MTLHPVTVHVPTPLYQRLLERAHESEQSVASELLLLAATAEQESLELPSDLEETLAALTLLDTGSLWAAARTSLDDEVVAKLEELNLKQQTQGLSPSELEVLDQLVEQHDRVMLIRAQAAVLLQRQGQDISTLSSHP
jgi:hypothetical protein